MLLPNEHVGWQTQTLPVIIKKTNKTKNDEKKQKQSKQNNCRKKKQKKLSIRQKKINTALVGVIFKLLLKNIQGKKKNLWL